MKIHKASLWHEALILLLYVFLSPFLFALFNKESIVGDSGMVFIAIPLIAIANSMLSWIVIAILKKTCYHKILEVTVWLIPFVISFFMLLKEMNHSNNFFSSITISNSVNIFIVYSISILYKISKVDVED